MDPQRWLALIARMGCPTGRESFDALAAAYAEAGRFTEAVKTAQKAVELALALENQDLARQILKRLELYRTGRPYREATGSDDP